MKRLFLTPILSLIFIMQAAVAFAQSPQVRKAAQSVFTLTTFNADGSIHTTTYGVFCGNNGEAIAMWHPFTGASRAVIIDARGKQYDVDAMLGASELYDICRFRVKDVQNAPSLQLVTTDAAAQTVYAVGYDLKKADIRKLSPVRTEKFMTTNNYYVFNDVDVSASMLGCPIVNESGQLLGIMQRPEAGGEAFSADARLSETFKLNGLSINDPTLKATGIRVALPQDEEQATVMLVLAAQLNDSVRYENYIDDFINRFPTSTEGYNARATRFFSRGQFNRADEMLQQEVKRAAKKDVAYSNYATMVYQAAVYRPDSTFTKWNLDKALELSQQAEKLNPLPIYKHQQAQILYAQGHYQQALEIFTSLQPTELGKNGEIYYEAAQCKMQLKAPDADVMQLLDKAVQAQTGLASAPYVLARGRMLDANKEYRKAFSDYMTYDSLMNYNANDDFYYLKFQCETKIRQYKLALNDIAHAIVLNRTEPTYYAEMASLQLRVNQIDNAVKTCDAALQMAPGYADLYIIKGVALCESKKKEDGIAALRKAQELNDPRAEGLIKKYSK
ncbi:MAG: trypsin-like peptidase domain-containing protein [Prevotella sp.]